MRNAFIDGLCTAAQNNPRIILITGDLGYRFLEPFRDRFPSQFLNIGVSEANMVSVAAGLSTCGFEPFIYSIATFASMRAFEQIRDVISLQKLNVKIVAIGAGLAYTKAGPTHHSVEDIALIRTLPNMTIINPVDTFEAHAATIAITKHTGPAYLRLEKNPDMPYHNHVPNFSLEKGYVIARGKEAVLFVTGTKISYANRIRDACEKKHISVAIAAMPTIKPLDNTLLRRFARSHSTWLTLEEHGTVGGFGSAITEWLAHSENTGKIRIYPFGLTKGMFSESGDYEYLLAQHGVTVPQIVRRIQKIFR